MADTAPEGTPPAAYLAVILGCSFIELIAASHTCAINHGCKSASQGWAVAAGVISIVASVATLFMQNPQVTRLAGIFLALWWLFGASITTFDEPFSETGNGYFAGEKSHGVAHCQHDHAGPTI